MDQKCWTVYTTIKEPGAEGKEIEIKVGSAYPSNNGGFKICLDALPASGQMEVRETELVAGLVPVKK